MIRRRTKREIQPLYPFAVALWSSGLSMREVGRRLGVDHKTVDRALSQRAGRAAC